MYLRIEAVAISQKIKNFNFIYSTYFWYEILLKSNTVNKTLQYKERKKNLQTVLLLIEELKTFLKKLSLE